MVELVDLSQRTMSDDITKLVLQAYKVGCSPVFISHFISTAFHTDFERAANVTFNLCRRSESVRNPYNVSNDEILFLFAHSYSESFIARLLMSSGLTRENAFRRIFDAIKTFKG